MRYAAVVAALAAVVGTLAITRDGASAPSPNATAAPAARVQRQAAQNTQEDFRWAGRLARGQEIEIRGISGDVRAEVASGDQVEVVGRRTGRDADRVRVEVVQDEDGVVVCAVHPGTRRGGGRSQGGSGDVCGGDHDGEGNVEEARVDFVVRVPAGVRFAAQTVAGDIHATALRSPVDVATVAGDVRVSTTATARAVSVSGDVDATFGETDGEEMDFATVSGDVVLRLAGDVGAEVDASTLSGDIHSDFPLQMGSMTGDEEDEDEDERGPGGVHVNVRIGQQATGTIGRGGPALTVNTVSGNIRLERAR